jgi:hypothetical protein
LWSLRYPYVTIRNIRKKPLVAFPEKESLRDGGRIAD